MRTIAKLGFLLVVIGFFMPVACEMDGFQLAELFMDRDSAGNALLLYGVFALSVLGLIIGALLLAKKNVPTAVDWVVLLACIGCGIAVYFGALKDDHVELETGAYVILTGWITSFIFQIISFKKSS